MPRRKLSEFRSKSMISTRLGLEYKGWSVGHINELDTVTGFSKYVVKVDQAVKGRFKKGLVKLDINQDDIKNVANILFNEGYSHLIIEPYKTHQASEERYLSISSDRSGLKLSYSGNGGVDIEDNADTIETLTLNESTDLNGLSDRISFSLEQTKNLITLFKESHFVFLEINPYISKDKSLTILDSAIEVDDAGELLTNEWTMLDVRNPRNEIITDSEKNVLTLDAGSSSSFNLSVLNPNGSIFLLLSGGGASVVVADEIYSKGLGKEIANYGEYSGNPSKHETYLYTIQVLELILASKAKKKVLFIGGAVANFTNIADTFDGIILAITEYSDKLKEHDLTVYVRRGGPFQEIGLKRINDLLIKYELLGGVYDPKTSIPEAIDRALEGLMK
jgi:ATP-citrate lyase beta-subunit